MKYALKKWWNYLIGLFGYLVASCVAIIPRVLVIQNKVKFSFPFEYVSYVYFFVVVIFALVGFIIQDLYRGYIRHKINDWDNDLENKYVNKAWMIFLPFLFSALLCLLSGLIFWLKLIRF